MRRRFPRRLISWSRLCAGKLNDPLVGRDVLIGLVAGCAVALTLHWGDLIFEWMGGPPGRPRTTSLLQLLGPRWAIAALLGSQPTALFTALFFLFMPVLLEKLFRKPAIAHVALFLILFALNTVSRDHPEVEWLPNLIFLGICFFVLLRYGLLALV